MSYEINVIVVGQECPEKLPLLPTIMVKNEIENQDIGRYAEIWPTFSTTKGILYSLGNYGDYSFFSALGLCDSDFDCTLPERGFPYWLSAQDKENLTPLIIKNNNILQELVQIIEILLKTSPQNRLLFQTRYQGGDTEVVFGTIQLKDFFSMLTKKQVLFNVCYILTENQDT